MSADNFFCRGWSAYWKQSRCNSLTRNVLLQLMEPESIVLAIPDKDLTTHQLAWNSRERWRGDLQWKYFTADEDEGSV